MELPSVIRSVMQGASLERLNELGVESCSDLANIFTSEKDIFDLSSDSVVVRELTQAWRMAQVFQNVKLERMSPYQPLHSERPAQTNSCMPIGAGLRPKMRCRPPAQLLPKPFRAGYAAAPLKGLPSLPDRRLAALQAVLEVVLASGSENTQFGPELRTNIVEAFELFVARFRNVPDARLQSHIGALKRWIKWHSFHVPSDVVYWKPPAFWLARYLAHVSKGGPTASCHAFASLKWWWSVGGLPLPMADGLVVAWASPTAEHVVQPRTPLALGIFWAMLRACRSATGAVASFLTWTLVLLVACLRFEHSKKSHSLRLQDGFIRATCAQGKRRVQGRRPPFDWAIPARITQTLDLSGQLFLDWKELEVQLGRPPTFIVQDLAVKRGQPLTSDTQKVARPMSLPKFNCLLRSVARGLGASGEDSDKLSSYSLRRFMPTAADVMQFQPHECQAIGNWVELPQTEASAGSKSHSVVGMATHYAHDKTSTAAFVKQQVVTALHQAMLKSGQPAQCSWHDVRLHVPPREAILHHLQPAPIEACRGEVSHVASADQSSVSDSSTSSASDDDYAKTAAELPWFTQTAAGKKHLIQSQQGSHFIPWCRDSVFAAMHVYRGVGVEEADELCQKCWARAPLAWRDAFRDDE